MWPRIVKLWHIFPVSRLVRQYKLLYKPWALSMGEGDFRPYTAPRPLDRFSWNLKCITASRYHGCSGQIVILTHGKGFVLFSLFFIMPHVTFLDTSPRTRRSRHEDGAELRLANGLHVHHPTNLPANCKVTYDLHDPLALTHETSHSYYSVPVTWSPEAK